MRRMNEGTHQANRGKSRVSQWVTLAAILIFPASELTAGDGGEKGEAKSVAAQTQEVAAGRAPASRRVVISIPDRKLALMEGDRVVKVYPVAVGARLSPSPSGEFAIVTRIPQPTYYAPGKVIPPGPANPLGTRWLGLSLKGFGIHGTNEPRSKPAAACASAGRGAIPQSKSGCRTKAPVFRAPRICSCRSTLPNPAARASAWCSAGRLPKRTAVRSLSTIAATRWVAKPASHFPSKATSPHFSPTEVIPFRCSCLSLRTSVSFAPLRHTFSSLCAGALPHRVSPATRRRPHSSSNPLFFNAMAAGI